MKRRPQSARAIRARMQSLLDSLEYDFSHFTMEDFVSWLERQRKTRIVFVPWTMPPGMSGAWVPCDNGADFVFFEERTPPVHQAHIQLHEMAHMLCGHRPLSVTTAHMHALFDQAVVNHVGSGANALLLRSTQPGEAEREAELLASMIQKQILEHNRLQELVSGVSSKEELAAYLKALKLD